MPKRRQGLGPVQAAQQQDHLVPDHGAGMAAVLPQPGPEHPQNQRAAHLPQVLHTAGQGGPGQTEQGHGVGLFQGKAQQPPPDLQLRPVRLPGEQPGFHKQPPGPLHQVRLLLGPDPLNQKLRQMLDDAAESGHLRRGAGDADDSHGSAVQTHRQVDARLHAGLIRLHRQEGQPFPEDPGGPGMELALAGGVGAGQDAAVAVHDVDVPADGFLSLVHNALGVLLGEKHGAASL